MFWLFLGYVLISAICYAQAKARGRDPLTWAGLGLMFGLLGLTALFLLPPIRPKKREKTPSVTPSLKTIEPIDLSAFWYYLDKEHNQLGPMSFERLSKAWQEGKLNEASYVWNEKMENWKRLNEVIQLEI